MKKTYIAPKTNVVEFKASSILAGSGLRTLSAGGGDDALGKSNNDDDWD